MPEAELITSSPHPWDVPSIDRDIMDVDTLANVD
jgi:hypothetical protein